MASNPLETTLRPFRISDAEDLLKYAGDEEAIRFTRLNTMTSKEEAISYIQNFCIPHPYCRSICINGDRCIGYVSVKPAESEYRCRAQLAYGIAREYWGQGITARAAKMAISEGFREFPDLVRLQSFVEVENKASQRELEKTGFQKEGVMRKYRINRGQIKDMVLFSLLSTDTIP
ncbi:hypothetical protein FNV43_RR01776 [Rhamnella rubrinervis]|uniref:N-acetyltransferase domain-containing protein n=1 Tax=Rhamnella rubrinervis TaxID=2594499 RepID=A0A8K0HRK9_9ROSA|nr:hypothetical protein FNV43_RR01776 [Rhamnella rubrinervis]